MNESILVAVGSAFWLGILTSISPCPLATNIAAISFIGSKVEKPSKVIAAGLLYTLGRTIAYILLGIIVVAGLLSIPKLAFFLQRNMNYFLGPILLLVGLFLLGLFRFKMPGMAISGRFQERVGRWGVWGAGLLGLLFALSFCPVSAALFFGSLIPIALEHKSTVLMPTVYGVGTAAPVVVFALVIALGTRYVGSFFNRLTQFEKWARTITGAVFVLVGLYYILVYIFGVQL